MAHRALRTGPLVVPAHVILPALFRGVSALLPTRLRLAVVAGVTRCTLGSVRRLRLTALRLHCRCGHRGRLSIYQAAWRRTSHAVVPFVSGNFPDAAPPSGGTTAGGSRRLAKYRPAIHLLPQTLHGSGLAQNPEQVDPIGYTVFTSTGMFRKRMSELRH